MAYIPLPVLDESTFTEGTTGVVPVGGEFNDASADVVAGKAAAIRITKKRAGHANLRDSSGAEIGTASAPLRTDPTGGTTQPISAAALPLPAGAATETTLGLVKAKTDNLDVALSTRTKPADQQHAIVDSSALPSGAATEATLSAIKTDVDKIPASPSQEHVTAASPHAVRLTDGAAFYKPTTPSDTQPVSGSVSVSNFPATQPVSGTVAVSNFPVKQPVSVAAGDDVAEGNTTDAAITSDTNGTVIGFLRGLVKLFADVWDSVNHWLSVSVKSAVTTTDLTTTGTLLSAGDAKSLPIHGVGLVLVEITGVWVGSLSILGVTSMLNVSGRLLALNLATYLTSTAAITGNGIFLVSASAFTSIRVLATSLASGSVNVGLTATSGTYLGTPLPTGSNTIGGVTSTETRPGSTVTVIDFTAVVDATRVLTLLPANANRRGATIKNETDLPLMVMEGGNATLTSYTDIVPPGARYVLDYPASTGILTAYLPQVPNGSLIATERV